VIVPCHSVGRREQVVASAAACHQSPCANLPALGCESAADTPRDLGGRGVPQKNPALDGGVSLLLRGVGRGLHYHCGPQCLSPLLHVDCKNFFRPLPATFAGGGGSKARPGYPICGKGSAECGRLGAAKVAEERPRCAASIGFKASAGDPLRARGCHQPLTPCEARPC